MYQIPGLYRPLNNSDIKKINLLKATSLSRGGNFFHFISTGVIHFSVQRGSDANKSCTVELLKNSEYISSSAFEWFIRKSFTNQRTTLVSVYIKPVSKHFPTNQLTKNRAKKWIITERSAFCYYIISLICFLRKKNEKKVLCLHRSVQNGLKSIQIGNSVVEYNYAKLFHLDWFYREPIQIHDNVAKILYTFFIRQNP